jgi:EmrB/QacA subfamily drug resistance transporter
MIQVAPEAATGLREPFGDRRPPRRPEDHRVNHTLVTAVVCLALAAVVSAMASLNVAGPDLARSTGATQTQLEWIIDAYSLIFASLLLPAGALGDRFGRRRALLGGLAVFIAASAMAFTSQSAKELIVLRGLLGAGAAFVMPATLSTITTTFPTAQRSRAVGIWATVAGGSAVVGLVCSGALLEVFSWRSVFGLNIALAAVAMAGVVRFVPESARPTTTRFDTVGSVLASAGLVAVVFSVIEAPSAGWMATRTLAGLAVGLAVLGAFVIWELRHKHPLLDPRLFARRYLTAGTLSIFMQFFAFYGFTFVALQYLQGVRGYSPFLAALAVLPLAAAMMPVGRATQKLAVIIGSRAVAVGGLALIGTGLLLVSQVDTSSGYWLFLAGIVPLGIGMGAATAPATTAITEALPRSKQGVGSALNDLSREVGGALGIAVIGSVLAGIYRSNLHLPGISPALTQRARGSFAVAVHAGGSIQTAADRAFVDGTHAALICAAAAALLAAVAVAVLHRGPRRQPQDSVSTTATATPPIADRVAPARPRQPTAAGAPRRTPRLASPSSRDS